MNSNQNLKLEIMLADDDKDDRFFFRELIDELNANVSMTEFEDGNHLTEHLKKIDMPPPPHMIFLDINMPCKTGLECLKEIRSNEKFCNVPIIMFTTSTNQRDIDDSYACGANLFIRKAYSFKEGIETLKKLFHDFRSKSLMGIPREEYFVG